MHLRCYWAKYFKHQNRAFNNMSRHNRR